MEIFIALEIVQKTMLIRRINDHKIHPTVIGFNYDTNQKDDRKSIKHNRKG